MTTSLKLTMLGDGRPVDTPINTHTIQESAPLLDITPGGVRLAIARGHLKVTRTWHGKRSSVTISDEQIAEYRGYLANVRPGRKAKP